MELSASRITETTQRLRSRVRERFPASSLEQVIAELEKLGHATPKRVERLGRPMYAARLVAGVLYLLLFSLLVAGAWAELSLLRESTFDSLRDVLVAFFDRLDNMLGTLVVVGGGSVVVQQWEQDRKRRAMVAALRDLRNLLDVIDLHQLTKDPGMATGGGFGRVPSSPIRQMSTFELSRYLSYCSEATTLTTKLATLYSQHSTDPIVLDAVDRISAHAQGVARGIQVKLQTLAFRDSGAF